MTFTKTYLLMILTIFPLSSIYQAISFVATMISDINIINKTSLDLTNSKLEENVEMKFEVTVRIVGFLTSFFVAALKRCHLSFGVRFRSL